MLTDPAVILRWGLGIALAALLWIVAYAMFNDLLIDRIGDAAHAITFLSLFAGISGLIVALVFRKQAAIRRQLVKGSGALVRWQVTEPQWAAFVRDTAPKTESDRKVVLGLIVFFAVVIPGAMALIYRKDYMIFAWISLGIMLIGIFGHAMARRVERSHFIYRGGDMALSKGGIVVNGVFHGWSILGSGFVGAELFAGAPGALKLTYRFWTRSGYQYVDVHAPVPAHATDKVRAALDRMPAVTREN